MTKEFIAKSDDRSQVSTEADRKTYVREWIARRLKAGGAAGIGMVGTLLTLPMLAAAQAVENFVNAMQIDGVNSIEAMPDGSAQLTMDNGVTISVPAEDVQIAANGDVLVSDRVVDIAADVMAGGGAGGLGAGAIAAGLGGVAVAAAAAGGSGGGDDGGPAPLPVLNGESFQTTVLGASGGFNSENTGIIVPEGTDTVAVTITDGDGNEISGEAQVDPANGDWTFTPPDGVQLDDVTVTVTVRSLDADGEEIETTSKDFTVDTIPPTITIEDNGTRGDDVLNIAEQGEGITVSGVTTGAEDGQEVTVTLSGATGATIVATGVVTGNAFSVEFSPSDLTDIGAWASATVTAEVSDAAGNPAVPDTDGFAIDLAAAITIETIAGDPVAAVDITAADRVGGFDVTGTVTDVEDGQPVTVTINGEPFEADVAGGAFTVPISAAFLNGLDAGPVTLNVSASVTDVAGNPATDTPAPIAADFTGPSIAIDPIPTANGDDTLNIAERTDGFEVSGTTDLVAPGSTVTVTVNGQDLTTTVGADGKWSVPVTQGDGGIFPPNGPVTIEASVTDTGSSLPASAVPLNFDVDLEAPTVTITTPIAGDDVLNIAEQGAGIAISGTTTGVEDGQSVTVTLSGGSVGATPIVGSATVTGNAFTVEFSSDDLAGIGAWPTATVTADVTDAAGNPATSDPETLGIDLTPPTLSIDDISGDNQIGLLDVQGDLVITGTTNAEDGQPVTVTFNGVDIPGGEVTSPGVWQATVPQATLQTIQATADAGDGTLSDIPVSATVSDAAGNEAVTPPGEDAPATATISADFNGPSITIDAITGDNVINAEENGDPAGIIISGSTNNVPAGQDVTVTLNGTTLTTVQTDANGDWQLTVPQGDADLPGDGETVTVTADVSDGETDAPQATVSVSGDFAAPTIAIATPIATDDIVNIAERDGGISISGTTSGAEVGQEVTVTFNGTALAPVEVDGSGNWTVEVPSDRLTGLSTLNPTDITAEVADAAGNTASANASITVDFSAPTIAITDVSVGDVMNAAEQGVDLVINGTAAGTNDGTVTVTFDGNVLAPVPVSGGTWTATVPVVDLASLTNGQTVEVTATASDPADNPGNVASASFTTDFTPPTIQIDNGGTVEDGFLNIADQSAGITFTGSTGGVEDGQQVTITLSGTVAPPISATGTVTGNAFTVDFSSTSLASIGGWPSANVTAEVSDAAGNPATPATDSFAIDLVAPTVEFVDPPGPDFVLDIEERGVLETEGVSVTTPEPDGTAVTLTFSRSDGAGGSVTDVTINTTVSNGGTFDIPLTPAQIAALQDETSYTLDLTITDGAGNTGTDQLSVPTDFAPILTIDEIGEGGAVDLSDTVGASITGTTLGVEEGRSVTVTATGATSGQVLNTTATVGVDGTWTLPIAPAAFDALVPGETFIVSATVDNAAGGMANANQAGIDAYEAALLMHANTATVGSTLTIAAFGNDGFNSNDGFTTEMSFTPTEAVYNAGSATQNPGLALFIVNDTQAGSGNVVISGGSLATPLPADSVVYEFDVTDQDAGPITLNFQDPDLGGPSELLIGTSGPDTLTASNIDSVIQGKVGDDSIDVSATGTNVVVFETDQASNGTDTVTGFTTGTTFQADEIAFFGQTDLRGAGDTVEALGTDGTLGADTGFVIFTTALGDTNAATIDTALEGLTGEQAGDVFYALAGDGTAASLVLATVTATDTITVQTLANFTDIGDLTLLSPDNVTLPDPATTPLA